MIRDALFLARKDLPAPLPGMEHMVLGVPHADRVLLLHRRNHRRNGGTAALRDHWTCSQVEDSGFLVDEFVHQLESVGYKVNRVNALELGFVQPSDHHSRRIHTAAFWPASKAQFRSAGPEPVSTPIMTRSG